MKRYDLTVKQQLKARAKVFRLLTAVGFQYEKQLEHDCDFYWRKISPEQRVCVAFNVPDQCLGGRTDWVWQIAELDELPKFGYSGSAHVSAAYGTVERVLDTTFEQFWAAGIAHYAALAQTRIEKAKTKLGDALTEL